MRTFSQTILGLCIVFLVFFIAPSLAHAADLLISPSSGSYTEGQAFTLRVYVSSPTQAINAVSGTVSFPRDTLQVTGVSKGGSILTLWVQDPSYSNAQGTVNFEGVVPNPGFSGSSGQVITITFRVLKSGAANVRLTSGSLLANDGYGTNVLNTLGGSSLTLNARPTATPQADTPKQEPKAVDPTPTNLTPTDQEDVLDLNKQEPVPVIENEKSITVPVPTMDMVLGWYMKFMSFIIPLLALIFFLWHTTLKGVHKVRRTKTSLKKDLENVERLVNKAFSLLKDDVEDSVRLLERAKSRRRLTEEEDAIIGRLRANLNEAEDIIYREVHKLEKEI